MKTPKRKHYFYESSIDPENGAVIMDAVTPELYEARWKRKNRIKQLKRSLERYKKGTNLPCYCHELHAYKLLQELKKPGAKATVNNWNFYTQRLLDIQSHIVQAIAQAGREAGACWEREYNRKEQS